jgi:hypothetical protein
MCKMLLMARCIHEGNSEEENSGYVVFTVKEISMDPLGNRLLVRGEHHQIDRQEQHGWQGKRYGPSYTVQITPAGPPDPPANLSVL